MTSHVPSSSITTTARDKSTGIAGLVDEEDYESLPTTSLKIQLLAGAIAGIAEHTIVYPIDAIKVPSPLHYPQYIHTNVRVCRSMQRKEIDVVVFRLECKWSDQPLRRCIRGLHMPCHG